MGYNPKVIVVQLNNLLPPNFSQIQQQWTHFSKAFQMSGRTPFKLKKKPILKFRWGRYNVSRSACAKSRGSLVLPRNLTLFARAAHILRSCARKRVRFRANLSHMMRARRGRTSPQQTLFNFYLIMLI